MSIDAFSVQSYSSEKMAVIKTGIVLCVHNYLFPGHLCEVLSNYKIQVHISKYILSSLSLSRSL